MHLNALVLNLNFLQPSFLVNSSPHLSFLSFSSKLKFSHNPPVINIPPMPIEMGRRRTTNHPKSHTLPSSPTHSFSPSSTSSASSFEFTTVSLSPRKCSTAFNPADELFYKGQILPLQPSPRISMLRALLLASSSASSSDTTTTGSRDSSGSSNDSNSSFPADLILLPECDSSRPSSVNEDDDFRRISNANCNKKAKYFAKLTKFSSVFRKDPAKIRRREAYSSSAPSSVKRMSATAKEVLRKYFKKVKPLYERLSQKQQQQQKMESISKRWDVFIRKGVDESNPRRENEDVVNLRLSFSGNLRLPRRKSYVSSCPSSMGSSPTHAGICGKSGYITPPTSRNGGNYYGDSSSMEELQSAIQGAITYCKNSMLRNNKSMPSLEI